MRHAVIVQAAHSLDCFLKDYGPDGCCNEGAQYYTHAGLCLFGAAVHSRPPVRLKVCGESKKYKISQHTFTACMWMVLIM